MNNLQFLDVLKASFLKYLETSPRSNEKLKVLHGAISKDLHERLLRDPKSRYEISSLGWRGGREDRIAGRYVDKSVDIAVSKGDIHVGGIAVKYVMSNYMQNSNNYFENMLGETANIRCSHIPYFQIFVIPDKIPYFDNTGNIKKWERINEHNLKKYIILSNDSVSDYLHTPNKTLVAIVSMSGDEHPPYDDRRGYTRYYTETPFGITFSPQRFDFGRTVIYNDYEEFMNKVTYTILSI